MFVDLSFLKTDGMVFEKASRIPELYSLVFVISEFHITET